MQRDASESSKWMTRGEQSGSGSRDNVTECRDVSVAEVKCLLSSDADEVSVTE